MRTIKQVSIIGASLFVSLNLLQAQTQFSGQAIQASGEVSAQPDSIVKLTAEAQGLNLISPTDLPDGGTFWTLMPDGLTAPFPCAPSIPNVPVYQIADGQFIVDATGGQVTLDAEQTNRSTVTAALETLAQAVVKLVEQVQEAQVTREIMAVMGLDEEVDSTPARFGAMQMSVANPDALWLEITNVANGNSYYNLHNATNQVYAILTKTNLLDASWNIEAELWPTGDQTNVMPFALANYERDTLLVRAMDWTGVDINGDGVPDWWLWEYFGTLDLNATNLDGDGNTLLADYTNNVVPNTFSFTGITVTNNYVSSIAVPVQLAVTGYPYYVAVLVDDTNLNNAAWNTYSSSTVTVNLGLTEGWHEVWIGLRGYADDATNSVWQSQRLKLDYTPPALVITNPTNSTVNVPMIQLQGFSPETLASISYDLTNAFGLVTHQQVLVEDRFYDTNTFEFTTNAFQAYDVPLTNGVNQFTFHATDLAGNVKTFVTNFTLSYASKTNPPLVQLLWPTNGLEICGSNIVCRGQVSDPTVTVTVQLVSADGETNTVGSQVGRDGLFYANNLTLADGTNHLSYMVTDAAGNTATTNLTVLTSDLGLTLDPVVAGQTVVTGTIDDTNYTICVNGVLATNLGDGTWSAAIAPIGIGGGAVVVNAVLNGGDPTLQQIVDPPQGVFVSFYQEDNQEDHINPDGGNHWWAAYTEFNHERWEDGKGGNRSWQWYDAWPGVLQTWNWPTASWPSPLPAGTGTFNYLVSGLPSYSGTANPPDFLAMEHCRQAGKAVYGESVVHYSRTADTEMKLATGGPAGSTQQNLWVISATATDATTGQPIPATQIQIGQLGNLDTNGNLYVVLPDNDPTVVTPMIAGIMNYFFTKPVATKVTKTVYFSVDPLGKPSSFDSGAVQKDLQAQLLANVFDNLPPLSVIIIVNVEANLGVPTGWNDNFYYNRVDWTTLNVGFASSAGGETRINPTAVNNWIFGLGGNNPTTQTWVNIFTHEGIWLNAGGHWDNDGNPAGEITSGTMNGFSQYTVLPSSRVTLRSDFGF